MQTVDAVLDVGVYRFAGHQLSSPRGAGGRVIAENERMTGSEE